MMDQNNSPESLTPPQASEPVAVATPVKTGPKKIIWAILGVAILLCIAAIANRQMSKTTKQTTIVPTQTATTAKDETVVFVRNNEIWTKAVNGEEMQIFNTNSRVYAFKYSPQSKNVAYITGKKITQDNGYTYVEPTTLSLGSIKSSQPSQVIFELDEPKSTENSDYTNQLRDVAFSPDGTQLAFTTSDSLWIYDIATATKKNVFTTIPQAGDKGGMIYAYANPIFSPDNSKILLTLGFYEGSGFGIVDISTGKLTRLTYTAYVTGTRAFGWIDNQHLAVSEYGFFDDPEATSSVYSVTLTNLDEKKLLVKLPGSISDGVVSGTNIYLMQNNVTPSGQQVGNLPGYDQFISIVRLKNNSQTPENVLKIQTASNNEGSTSVYKLMPFNDSVLTDVGKVEKTKVIHSLYLDAKEYVINGGLTTN